MNATGPSWVDAVHGKGLRWDASWDADPAGALKAAFVKLDQRFADIVFVPGDALENIASRVGLISALIFGNIGRVT